eukprot:793817-Amphidinium_carterae.1
MVVGGTAAVAQSLLSLRQAKQCLRGIEGSSHTGTIARGEITHPHTPQRTNNQYKILNPPQSP